MIESLHVKNFRVFSRLEIDDFKGVNLFLGLNDTGKSGLLKLLYAMLKSLRSNSRAQHPNKLSSNISRHLEDKLIGTFNPRLTGLAELVSVGNEGELQVKMALAAVEGDRPNIFTFEILRQRSGRRTSAKLKVSPNVPQLNEDVDAIFLPPKEVLTIYKEILYAKQKGELSGFDDTYTDLASALSISTTKGRTHEALKTVCNRLEALFEGKVTFNEALNDFVYQRGNHKFSISFAAEGIRKIGILTQLIRNRELYPGSFLFIDEPETALHPIAIRAFMNMIMDFQDANIQVFMATHNYFVLKELEQLAKRRNIDIGCYSLMRRENGIVLESSNLKEGIPENDIINVSVRMFDDELSLKFGSKIKLQKGGA